MLVQSPIKSQPVILMAPYFAKAFAESALCDVTEDLTDGTSSRCETRSVSVS